MTSAGTYTLEIDLAGMLGVVTRARTPENTVQEFLSVDPLARKNSHQSPYAFADNSPISIVDIEGGDGILYILVLPGAEGKFNAELVVAHANELAREIGLIVEVKLYHGIPEEFNREYMDRTDNFILIGGTSKELETYVKSNGLYTAGQYEFFYENNKFVAQSHGRIEGEAIGGFSSASKQLGLLSFVTINRDRKLFSDKPSVEQVLGLESLHEAGHNMTGSRHNINHPGDTGFMGDGNSQKMQEFECIPADRSGNRVPTFLWNEKMRGQLDLNSYIPSNQSEYRKPVDNYEANKAAANSNENKKP